MFRKGNDSITDQCALRSSNLVKKRNERRNKMLNTRRSIKSEDEYEDQNISLSQLHELCSQVLSPTPEVAFNAIHLIKSMVKKTSHIPDKFSGVVSELFTNGVINKFIEYIQITIPIHPTNDILDILIYITGDDIGTDKLLSLNIIQVLLPYLNNQQYFQNICWIYCNLVCSNIMARDDIFNLSMPILLPMIQNGLVPQNKYLIWLFNNFSFLSPKINFDLYKPCFDYLLSCLATNDGTIISEIFICFSRLLSDETICEKILSQVAPLLVIGLKERNGEVVKEAFNGIGVACGVTDVPINYFVKQGIFDVWNAVIMEGDNEIKQTATWCLSNILGGKDSFPAELFVDKKYIKVLVNEIINSTDRMYNVDCGYCLINTIVVVREEYVARIMRTPEICTAFDSLLRLKHKTKESKNTFLHWIIKVLRIVLIIGEKYKSNNENVYAVMMEDCCVFSALQLLEDDSETTLDNCEEINELLESFNIYDRGLTNISEDSYYTNLYETSSFDSDSSEEEN
ncbi:hypothetical protein EHI8A_182790 [Entamoeba histolytica HM-1:IMSS-B]|uniref:Importin alpha n=6 Tax=Entamoeba histolytica TaxID=5759 RepID=C4LSE6_ENTH1|nr:hypothetical protein EHI_153560 [Entamoeba histolytica HM-1:IMSS]EMD45364.1 Hypothetical protein EHI5A_186350 [Entamoeba histolytica KU27]EMH73375.1 hypothetical protein EHI8A_182790 [Entamoeba histolytica HM-1:IMSS-B]EMS15153.1 hypothetical protein KM1_250190 [Entamoeba histolytica HM-3:IMSS]ENY61347.1 hypothetical protein EHI7A_159410 [Entamoeba histolytica HM-1:IMSS-A]GAT91613.1 hypothetical protein CL6EHI_153560 [Entamoeba histolytica]|eukprot:XP_656361.2 hypothetical protein EHI_153560 [Entamoeba histolytica HM-1:IMSS]